MSEYCKKVITAKQAAELVKDGDLIVYSDYSLFPKSIDAAIADRMAELNGVLIRAKGTDVPECIRRNVDRSKIAWADAQLDVEARFYQKNGLCNYVPGTYYQEMKAAEISEPADILYILTTPMDKHGYFNFGLSNSNTNGFIKNAKCIVVEVNEKLPYCYGGEGECIHISDVDYVVEAEPWDMYEIFDKPASESERMMAGHIIKELKDGDCLQLGIGGLPAVIGNLICESDLKDLGVHTELLNNSYYNMFKAGKITNRKKPFDKGKMTYTFAYGPKEFYEFIDHNPACASYPSNYTNNPKVVAQIDNFISINSGLEIDLFSQVSSESVGINQISGTGGQLDFAAGAFDSNGGKSFICINSTYTDKQGKVTSKIKPFFSQGTVVTLPRSLVHYVVTEYGVAQLKGLSTWARAEALINIAHPDFRDELIKDAERLHIWSYTNKKS